MLDEPGMDPTLTSAIRPRTPPTGFLGLVPIMLGILAVLVMMLVFFEGGRALAARLEVREQALVIMLAGMAINAAWPHRCGWLRGR